MSLQRALISRNFSFHLLSISQRTFFGKNRHQKSSSPKDSHLHTFLLKEGNKNISESTLLAINDYDQAIATEDTSEAYSKRGWAYFYIKDYDQAMNDINKAIKLNPRSIEAQCAAASVKIALNEHHEALEYLSNALELTSPMDFRRHSIEQVMNGSKLSLKIGSNTNTETQPIQDTSDNTDVETKETLDAEIVHDPNVPSPQNMVDLPFDNTDFMNLQKDLTAQMCDIGGEQFQAKLMKLNEIPAVQRFQRKALNGEKPDYNDYMELMKDKKFRQYNEVMTEIAKNPKFESVTVKFGQMDWMGAYKELQKDPEALALYMKAFEALDDD
eukprot:280853_1